MRTTSSNSESDGDDSTTRRGNQTGEEKEGFMDKMKRSMSNCCAGTGLCCFKFKEQTQISALEFKIKSRQKKFGVDYLTLVENKASPQDLKSCLKDCLLYTSPSPRD